MIKTQLELQNFLTSLLEMKDMVHEVTAVMTAEMVSEDANQIVEELQSEVELSFDILVQKSDFEEVNLYYIRK